jgi:hypothetical protein
MARDSLPHETDLDTLILEELLTPRSHKTGPSRPNGHDKSALTDALATALGRALAEASPLDRALFAEALAPAIAEVLAPALVDALSPALADALTPALANALGSLFPSRKTAHDSEAPKKAAQDKGPRDSGPPEPDEGARTHDRK